MRAPVLILLPLVLLLGCPKPEAKPIPSEKPPATEPVEAPETAAPPPRLLVFAAASLTDVLPQVAQSWKPEGGAEVTFSFGASSKVAKQVEEGAPADLVFTADREWMDYLADATLIDPATRVDLLGNTLVVIVPAAATVMPRDSQALTDPSFARLALAGETVPAGKYAQAALDSARVWQDVQDKVVRAPDVRAALAYVAKGEADAGIVYATDATAETGVKVAFSFPEGSHPPITYPAAVVSASPQQELAQEFLAYCQTSEAQGIFTAAGFGVIVAQPLDDPATQPATTG